MTVLGIDPGTAVLGYGVVRTTLGRQADRTARVTATNGLGSLAPGAVRTAQLVECGVVRTRAAQPLADRLSTIFAGVAELIARHQPDVIAVEGLFHGRNARSALVLGHARGVVLLAAAQAAIPLVEISPREVKRAVTGTGAATKPQVAVMLSRLLRLTAPPRPADAADGVAIALTQWLRIQSPARALRSR